MYFHPRMGRRFKISFLFFAILSVTFNVRSGAQTTANDTLLQEKKYNQFYDSLQYKANQNRITRFFYDFLISPPRPYVDKETFALEYYSKMEGKTISEIDITALDVFGPTLNDTTKKAKSWLERLANAIHTKSNLSTIKKMLMFKVGDVVDAE